MNYLELYKSILKKEDRNYSEETRLPVSLSLTKTTIANNDYLTSYPSPVSRAIVTGIECSWKMSTIYLFQRFQEETKQKHGRKMNEQIRAQYKDKYKLKARKYVFIC